MSASIAPASFRPELVEALIGGGAVVPESTRRIADGGRIRFLLAAFSVVLLLSLAGLMLLLVSSIFDRVTPSIRNDLEWKATHGAVELAQAMDVGIAAEDRSLIAKAASAYVKDADIAGILVLGADGQELYRHGNAAGSRM